MVYFIDTNIFLRVLLHDHEAMFQESVVFLERVKNQEVRAVTSSLVIAEVIWTLRSYYEFSKDEVVRSANSIFAINSIKIVNTVDDHLAVKLFQEHSVKYIDACIASIPQVIQKKWTIISYDQDFKKLPVLWKEPSELLNP